MENYISVKSILIIVLEGITKSLKANAEAAQMLFLWLSFTCKVIIFLQTELAPPPSTPPVRCNSLQTHSQNVDPYIALLTGNFIAYKYVVPKFLSLWWYCYWTHTLIIFSICHFCLQNICSLSLSHILSLHLRIVEFMNMYCSTLVLI